MTPSTAIARERPAELGLDQPRLHALGMDRVRVLAGRVWTDHNLHDPGITILESISYALTELTYRALLPIEDLLAGSDSFASQSAARMLPSHPLTVLDYRRLMIDVAGVGNAWIEPQDLACFADPKTGEIFLTRPDRPGIRDIALRGVYRARIAWADDAPPADPTQTCLEVLKRLRQHRNLCEDFADVTVVEKQAFLLCGEVELAPEADTNGVHQEILRRVRDYLAPRVGRHTRDVMLARRKADGTPYTAADLFDGPLLDRGFIDDDELRAADLRTDLRLSDIVGLVTDVPGVRAVRRMLIGPEPAPGVTTPIEDRWVVAVDAGKQASLNTGKCRLVYYKGDMPIVPGPIDALPADAGSGVTCEDIPIPAGRPRDVKNFTSFQSHFPAIYGLDEHRLPESAPPRRRGQAMQLKAYLLFFDQVMANYCAQLAHLADLFAMEAADTPTYRAQVVNRSTDYLAIYGTTEGGADALAAALDAGVETTDGRHERRARFLDHLIARVAERFHDYVHIMRSVFGATDLGLLEDRREFLEQSPDMGRDRGHAYDATLTAPEALWDTRDNVSGLERRLALLLGIGDFRRRDLTQVVPGADATVTGGAPNDFGFTLTDGTGPDAKVLLTEAAKSATADLATAQMLRALEYGQWTTTYVRNQTSETARFFTLVAKDGEVVGRSGVYATGPDLENAIVELRTYLRRHYSREGLYVIENLLLRPVHDKEATLHFCVEPGCVDCGDDDPYSFRIHVILPAYAGRFNDMGFRRFAEATIRAEVPAHILPKICWIDEDSMTMVQTAWHDWLEVAGDIAADQRATRLASLVKALTAVKSVYPVQKIVPCDTGEGEGKFIVGRTALGTKQETD